MIKVFDNFLLLFTGNMVTEPVEVRIYFASKFILFFEVYFLLFVKFAK